jgi:hypothetical protein
MIQQYWSVRPRLATALAGASRDHIKGFQKVKKGMLKRMRPLRPGTIKSSEIGLDRGMKS